MSTTSQATHRARAPAGLIAPIELYRQALGSPHRAPMADHMNITMLEVDVGRIVFGGVPQRTYYNPMGTVHGGYFGVLLDTAMGCAVHTALSAGFGYTTLEYKVSLVRAMTEATGPIRCEGQVQHMGRRIATAEGRIVDASGQVYAHGTTTCLVVPPPEGIVSRPEGAHGQSPA